MISTHFRRLRGSQVRVHFIRHWRMPSVSIVVCTETNTVGELRGFDWECGPPSDTFQAEALIRTDNLIDTASNRYTVDFISDQHYVVHRSYRLGHMPLMQAAYWLFFKYHGDYNWNTRWSRILIFTDRFVVLVTQSVFCASVCVCSNDDFQSKWTLMLIMVLHLGDFWVDFVDRYVIESLKWYTKL